MLKRLPAILRGALSFILYAVNTLFWIVPIQMLAMMKLIIPLEWWRNFCDRLLNGSANRWVGVNSYIQDLFCDTRWLVNEIEPQPEKGWYLVLANHQSWVDILVLQRIFHNRIPFLKFFLKKELFWVPVLGIAWWALDFPFMKRYSHSYLKKHPNRAGKDMEITQKACEKFKKVPVSIMNFVEGTRFTEEKHQAQRSPFNNLLKTHAGGIAYVLSAMSGQLNRIMDVTIVYPGGAKRFWDFICGNIDEIRIHVNPIAIPEGLIGDYLADRVFRSRFHQWLNDLWTKKDMCFEALKNGGCTPPYKEMNLPVLELSQLKHMDYSTDIAQSAFPEGRTPASM